MRIHVKHLRHDSYKIKLQILTTPIDEVIIVSTFAQVLADLQPLRLFYWVYLRLRKFPPVNRKAKLKTRYFSGVSFQTCRRFAIVRISDNGPFRRSTIPQKQFIIIIIIIIIMRPHTLDSLKKSLRFGCLIIPLPTC